mgnify:CR=1 FL=1
MIIKILGTGCSKCNKLEENTKKAVMELNIDATIEKISDLREMVAYGVMNVPALVVDDEVKVAGKVLSSEEIKKYLR